MIPKGFDKLVGMTMKERPNKPKNVEEIWDRFLRIVFMGGKRSEPENTFIINMLKPQKLLDRDYLKKTDGEDWRDAVGKILDDRTARIKDEDTVTMLKDFQKELFRVSASIKGGARFFEKNNIRPEFLEKMLQTKETTKEFIDDLVSDEDVSNIKYTKVIIWLHSLGYAEDFCPPSYQTKNFVNEIYGYYQFYEDDKHFMEKAQEFAEEVKKKIKKATVRDVAAAIFLYVNFKNMLPPRSPEKKKFSADLIVKFLTAKKLTLKAVSEKLGDFEAREKLAEIFYEFVHKVS